MRLGILPNQLTGFNGPTQPHRQCRTSAPLLYALSSPLITLDLDDTLWPTGEVVAQANVVLLKALEAAGAAGCTHEDVMIEMRRVRTSWRGSTPPRYTQQRTLAIEALLKGRGVTNSERYSKLCFELWLQARHSSAERLLFPGTVEALEGVRAAFPTARIVAVTNGRGDPLSMPTLAPFFDLTVSGEDDDVHPHRKPAPQIFRRALERAGGCARGEWAHVGDCKVNDASAGSRATSACNHRG